MKSAVQAAWHSFSTPLEGRCLFMYADAKGLVTTGVGNLIDPVQYALQLPWKRPDGSPATRDEVVAAYAAVKARDDWKLRGGGVYAQLTTLRLTDEDVDALVARKLAQNEVHLRGRFVEYDDWCADAQLFVHSMAWACGAGFRFPVLETYLRTKQWEDAIGECTIHPEMGTIVERNRRNRQLLKNAARVQAFGLNPEQLYWPGDLADVVTAAPTQPELPEAGVDPAETQQARRDALSDAMGLPFLGWRDEDEDL